MDQLTRTVVAAAASPTPLAFDAGAVRRRIGLIALATDLTLEADFAALLGTAELGLFTTRVAFDNPVTDATLRAIAPRLKAAAQLLLPGEHLDAVVFGCTAATAALGQEAVAAAVAAGRPATPCITPISALRAATAALGVRRLSLLLPYSEAVSRAMAARLEALGFEIVALHWLGVDDDRAIAKLTPATIEAAAVAACPPRAEALFCSCTNLRAAALVPQLEQRLGRPVLTSNRSMIWETLRHAGAPLDYRLSRFLDG